MPPPLVARLYQDVEQHFSESRDFVQNIKHVFHPQTVSEANRSRLTT